jgi:outer membrane protein insertion porin family/translocation and assembly module TamA
MAVCAILLAVTASPGPAQMIDDSLEIKSVRFEGGEHFPDQILSTAIVTSPTRCNAVAPLCWFGVAIDRQYLDTVQLALDTIRLNVFYYRAGYRDAAIHVNTSRDDGGVAVRFLIEEGPPVRVGSIQVEGADTVPREVTRSLPLRIGDPLNVVAHEAARDTMVSRLRNRGYAYADGLANYDISADSPFVAHVSYQLIPGPLAHFGEIEIVGAQKVDSAVVRKMITFQPGDLFTLDDLRTSQRNLFSQEVFAHAEVRAVMRPEPESVVPVRVQVNEGDMHRVRAGVGMSTEEYVNAEGRWVARSFRGGARRLELRARVSNLFATSLPDLVGLRPPDDFYGRVSGLVSADFTQPWFFDALNTLGAGVFAERRSIRDVFVRSAVGGYLTFSRSLAPGTSVSAGYRPELTSLEAREGDFIFCVGFTACDEDAIAALTGSRWLSPFVLTLAHDRANSIFAPTTGYSIRTEAEVAAAATASDFAYGRLTADLIDYHSWGGGIVSAIRLKPGLARPLSDADSVLGVHPQKRFFAGGANSVRGFAQYRLGPKVLIADAIGQLLPADSAGGAGCSITAVNDGSCDAAGLIAEDPNAFRVQPVGGAMSLEGSFEVRFPVAGPNLRAAAFVDYGQVWDSHRTVDLNDIVLTPGLGIRYFSPIGPLRIDVGYYPGRGESLRVLTSEIGRRMDGVCMPITMDEEVDDDSPLCQTGVLQALDPNVRWNPRRSFFQRLQLHFSIGQAF